MERLSLRPMTVDEFDVFRSRTIRGYAAEQETVRHGASAIGLNVFGWNSAARSLYEKAGYQIMSMHMHKGLSPSA